MLYNEAMLRAFYAAYTAKVQAARHAVGRPLTYAE